MPELAFAARHVSASPDGFNTVFHFRDDDGKTLTLRLDGEVGDDFADRCRIYYEPDLAHPPAVVLREPDVESRAGGVEIGELDLLTLETHVRDDSTADGIAEALNAELRRLMDSKAA